MLFVKERIINRWRSTSDHPFKSLGGQLMVSIYHPHRKPEGGDEDLPLLGCYANICHIVFIGQRLI